MSDLRITTPGRGVSIVTACLPTASDHLAACAASVAAARAELRDITVEWVVAIDGPGTVRGTEQADLVITLPERRGVSVARNYAFAETTHDFTVVLDGDDEVVAHGIDAAVRRLVDDPSLGWVAANRLLTTGEKTVHWHGERRWERGDVAAEWSAPMAFHSNTLVTRSDLIREAGGWPALSACEDLFLALKLGEIAPGLSIEDVLIRYRAWEGQATRADGFRQEQTLAYGFIESSMNTTRRLLGRPPITSPEPLSGLGSVPV